MGTAGRLRGLRAPPQCARTWLDNRNAIPVGLSRDALQCVAEMDGTAGLARIRRFPLGLVTAWALSLLCAAAAQTAPATFDLAGPTIEVDVTRNGRVLPAAQVPSLAAGDVVGLKADLSTGQAAHYLMVAAFLRGATNPPPTEWFSRCETWKDKCAAHGLSLTVPPGAQQLLVFMAPATGGDFKTLVNAVRGRPGAFVRTSQDLNQASLDHARLETYLAAIRSLGEEEPARLAEAAPLLARSLAIKVDEKCLGKIPVLQAPCLSQGREALILDDGHSASIAQQLTSGPASDLALEASNTPQLRSGYYGPFIGSFLDLAKMVDSFHTAQYQYFPALTSANGRQLGLTLNAPPSFHDPMSVLVVALPAIEAPQFPPLRPVDPEKTVCARKEPLVLPVEGAPLVFSSSYAHDLALRFPGKDGSAVDIPARADPARGGFIVQASALSTLVLHVPAKATLHGQWGFDSFEGPSFQFTNSSAQPWWLDPKDAPDLIVGRPDTVHLHADSVSCLDTVTMVSPAGKQWNLEWKATGVHDVEVKLPLQESSAGTMALLVKQFGEAESQRISFRAFTEPARLERFSVHSGDSEGTLHGNRLDEVETLSFAGTTFVPGTLSTSNGQDDLVLQAEGTHITRALKGSEATLATATLRDGRTVQVKASVDSARPSATLLSKSVRLPDVPAGSAIQLADERELPLRAELTFSLRALSPASFSNEDKIEVATANRAYSVVLGVDTRGITLQSSKIAVVTVNPSAEFGTSAFGPLRYRRIVDSVAGDWHPLVTLVRLPDLTRIQCPDSANAPCSLEGSRLYLLDSVSSEATFSAQTRVPDGFTARTLTLPRPTDGRVYFKLRDDPAVVSVVTLSVVPLKSQASQPASDSETNAKQFDGEPKISQPSSAPAPEERSDSQSVPPQPPLDDQP